MKLVAQGENASNVNMIVPGGLLLAVCGVVTYHHSQSESYEHSLSMFLAAILMQMLPLIALKLKIYACGDRLALVPRVIVKTLLMHLILALFRVAPNFQSWTRFWQREVYSAQFWFDVAVLGACIIQLRNVFGFKFTLRSILDETEVRNLCAMAVVGAIATESACLYLPTAWLSEGTKSYIQDVDIVGKIVFTAANFIDVLAFMPVVWKLYQAENDDDSAGCQVHEDARRQVLLFFAFVIAFYSWDDVIDPIRTFDRQESVALMAHGAHFVLLLDFAGFFIFQVWAPSNAKGEQLQGLLQEDTFDEDA